MKLWRVHIERHSEATLYVAAETERAAEEVAEEEFDDDGDVTTYATEATGLVAPRDLNAEVLGLDGDPQTVEEFMKHGLGFTAEGWRERIDEYFADRMKSLAPLEFGNDVQIRTRKAWDRALEIVAEAEAGTVVVDGTAQSLIDEMVSAFGCSAPQPKRKGRRGVDAVASL